ncbi:MAG: hypothetical protein KDA28_16375, partial [Phycisphaerales bacterium]|nr:hypothetical protein [Phycisphaerales bacterium]
MSRTLLVSILVAWVVLFTTLLVIGGCAMVPLPHDSVVAAPEGLVFRNATRDTLEVQVYLARDSERGPTDLQRGPLVTVRRGAEVVYPGPIPDADIVRLRVERVVPSWEESEPIWW